MDASKLTLGTKVRYENDYGYPGEVVGEPQPNGKVTVRWGEAGQREKRVVDIEELELIDEEADRLLAAQIQSRVDTAKSAFEQAFKAFQEATQLSQEQLSSFAQAKLINMGELEEVLESNGWSTSSLYC